ncbi:MAG: hypothetical protein HOH19_00540 [Kordiimonadaceae bacterium]|nr:hypothetical protein [Kordiimonadaceae bacterium]
MDDTMSDLVIQEFDADGNISGSAITVMEGVYNNIEVPGAGIENITFFSMDVNVAGDYVVSVIARQTNDNSQLEWHQDLIGHMVVDPDTWTSVTDYTDFFANNTEVFGQISMDADGGSTLVMRNRSRDDDDGAFAGTFMLKYDADGNIVNGTNLTAKDSYIDAIYNGTDGGRFFEHADDYMINLFPNMTTSTLMITDTDLAAVQEVRIEFETGFLVAEDTIAYSNDAGGAVTGSIDANGLLVLTATGGGDLAIADANIAINSLYYQNIEGSGNQTEGVREISITVVNSDGSSADPATYYLNVKVNDAESFSITDESFTAIDGGHLTDTVNVDMENLDLSDVSLSGKINNIDAFDLSGDGFNTLSLGLDDMLAMTGPFEDFSSISKNYIEGDVGDSVNLVGADWGDLVASNFGGYNRYQSTELDLRINENVKVNLVDTLGDLDTSAVLSQTGKVQALDGHQGEPSPVLFSPIRTDLANGDYVLTVSNSAPTDGGNGYLLAMRIYNSDGTPDGDEFVISHQDTGGRLGFPQTIANDDGGFTVLWLENDVASNTYIGYYGQKFDANGIKVGGEVLIMPSTESISDTSHTFRVVKGANDGYEAYITEKDKTGSEDYSLTLFNIDSDLALTDAGTELYATSSSGVNFSTMGGIALTGGGTVAYAFDYSTSELLVSTITPGNSINNVFISGLTSGTEFNNGVALDNGGFAILYSLDNAGDATHSDLIIQEFGATGIAVGAPITVMEDIMTIDDVNEIGVYDVEFIRFFSLGINTDGEYIVNATTGLTFDTSLIEYGHANIGHMVVDPDTWVALSDYSTFSFSNSQVFGHVYGDADGGASFYMRNRSSNDELGQFGGLFKIKYDAEGNIVNYEDMTAMHSDLDVIYAGNTAGKLGERGDADLVNLFPNMTTDGLAITDTDLAAVQEVQIQFESGFLASEDTLGYVDANGTIDGTLDGSSLLVLTATAGGDLSTADAEAAINSLYYQNIEGSGIQTEGIREISITVVNSDGSSADPATYYLNVKVNDTDIFTITDASFTAIDGGHLSDTVNIDMVSLDLSDVSLSGKINNVENFDLTGDGNNTLSLGLDDLIDMTGPFENGTSVQKVYITGEAGDTVNMVGADWGDLTVSNDGANNNYQSAEIDLRINQDITVLMPDVL